MRLVVGGVARAAHTNADGNFFLLGASPSGAAQVGIRNATSTHVMAGAPASGDCNGCHNGTTTSPIHLP